MPARTPKEQAAYELELLDDRICDLYSGQDNTLLFHNVSSEEREKIQRFLSIWLNDFRLWRERNEYTI